MVLVSVHPRLSYRHVCASLARDEAARMCCVRADGLLVYDAGVRLIVL